MIIFLIVTAWILFGVWIAMRGWRGRIDLTGPTCAKCRYDLRALDPAGLRACPECGADLTNRKRVNYGRMRRRPALIVLGLAMLAIPFALQQTRLLYLSAGVDWNRIKPKSWLINDLAAATSNPGAWMQLEKLLIDNKLNADQVNQAIDQLSAQLNASPQARSMPLHWQQNFLASAEKAGLVRPETRERLLQAYYQDAPALKISPNIRPRLPETAWLNISAWDLPGFQRLVALRRVLLDGHEIRVYDQFNPSEMPSTTHGSLNVLLQLDAVLGPHELTFEVDMGIVSEADAGTYVSDPGPSETWPKPVVFMRHTIKVPITIVTEEELAKAAPQLVADPALAEEIRQAIEVKAVRLVPANGQMRVTVDYLIRRKTPIPVSFGIYAEIEGVEVRFGDCNTAGGGYSSSSGMPTIAAPPDEVTTARVIFRTELDPNNHWDIDAVWDGEIIYADVPLERGGGGENP